MKSLNDSAFKSKNSSMFTDEIMEYITKEGFVEGKSDSYCVSEMNISDLEWEDTCYKKYVSSSLYSIHVYIFSFGIGVDFDYTCGGNSFVQYWKFEDYDSFEEVYDYMVESVNRNR